MWRDNFLQIFKDSNLTSKQLAERSAVSEKTIIRIVKHPDATIYLDTLEHLSKGLGCKLSDITQDTKTVLGNESLATLQEKVENLQKQLEITESEKGLLLTDNNLLKTEVTTLSSRLELTETKLMYCEKLLAVYERYTPKTE